MRATPSRHTASDDDTWSPLPLSHPLFGHYFTGALKVPPLILLMWGATLVPQVGSHSLSDLSFTVVVVLLVSETASTLIDRVFVLRHRTDNPPTRINHVLNVLAGGAIGFLGGVLLLGGVAPGIACAVGTAAVNLVEVLWTRPWTQSFTREEVAEKWEATKEMTRETFGEDVREIKRRAGDSQRRRWERDQR